MTTYTEEELKQAYQLGYSHCANGQPPLDGSQVLRVVEVVRTAAALLAGNPE